MKNNNQEKNGITMDDLARIVQDGFMEIKTEMKEMRTDISEIKTTVENIEADLNKKVDKVEHNTLGYRVEKLEKKFA